MQDLYLSFPDQASADALLFTEERPNFQNIDVIGTIYKPTEETTEQDGIQVPVMAPIPGWHVNVRLVDGEDATALEPFAVTPATPMRVWG